MIELTGQALADLFDFDKTNPRVACSPCNQRKGNRLVSECDWLAHLH